MKCEPPTKSTFNVNEPAPVEAERQRRKTVLTVPNLLSAIRLFGSPLLIVLAWGQLLDWCLGWFVFLVLTDWLDGKLAARLDQQTTLGAKLDSVADATFYACLLLAMMWLEWGLMVDEAIWIGLAVLSYVLSFLASLAKFRRMPSYHTRMAKTSWLLIAAAIVAILVGWSTWPLRVAMAGVIVTNLEATAITLVLGEWHVNVLSLRRAFAIRRKESGQHTTERTDSTPD
jgi:CDP-diacylglycerol--glycerol-3-phosphate 3-phosphatidyltransferase